MNIIQKIFGTHSQNELKRVYPIADAVMALDEDMQKLSDEELKAKTKEFKERLENGVPSAFPASTIWPASGAVKPTIWCCAALPCSIWPRTASPTSWLWPRPRRTA